MTPPNFHIVLVHPRIPQNTGNIARLCAATRSMLHIIRPAGFRLDDKAMKRAGLDYWEHLDWRVHDNWDAFMTSEKPKRMFLFSKRADKLYTEAQYKTGDCLVFGSETNGLPEEITRTYRENLLRIPMLNPAVRSLNLADSAAIALYEALRQCEDALLHS